MDTLHRSVLNRLSELKIELPRAPKPVGSYLPGMQVMGNLIYISGQLPMKDGQLLSTGQVPSRCSVEDAKLAARQCVINALAIVKSLQEGLIDRVSGVVRIGAFVSSDTQFTEQPMIANAASDFLVDLFGERGRHVRAAVGVNVLPLDAPVEIEFVFWAIPEMDSAQT